MKAAAQTIYYLFLIYISYTLYTYPQTLQKQIDTINNKNRCQFVDIPTNHKQHTNNYTHPQIKLAYLLYLYNSL